MRRESKLSGKRLTLPEDTERFHVYMDGKDHYEEDQFKLVGIVDTMHEANQLVRRPSLCTFAHLV